MLIVLRVPHAARWSSRDIGATHVAVLVAAFTDTNASTLAPYPLTPSSVDPTRPAALATPTDASLLEALASASKHGMAATIWPVLDLNWAHGLGDTPTPVMRNNHTRDTRSDIGWNFTDAEWLVWWPGYQRFVLRYANVARHASKRHSNATATTTTTRGVFSLGSELSHAFKAPALRDRWCALAGDVRKLLPDCAVTIASRPEEAAGLAPLWGCLDAIGINARWPLKPTDDDHTVRGLTAAWQPIKAGVARLATAHSKQVIFTAVAYQSRNRTYESPRGKFRFALCSVYLVLAFILIVLGLRARFDI